VQCGSILTCLRYKTSNETPEPLWDKRTVARYLGISVKTLTRMLYAGSGPQGIKIGAQWRWRPKSVQEYLESCQTLGGGVAA
jgi:predicted DNA-binding transcriptional regulator AlpA